MERLDRRSFLGARQFSTEFVRDATRVEEAPEQRAPDIGAYQGNATPYFWGTYPEARAAVEYLQKEGLLTFRDKKIEIEDVGPPFVAPTEDDLDYEFVEDRIY